MSSVFTLAKSLGVALSNQPTVSTKGAIQLTHSWVASFDRPEHRRQPCTEKPRRGSGHEIKNQTLRLTDLYLHFFHPKSYLKLFQLFPVERNATGPRQPTLDTGSPESSCGGYTDLKARKVKKKKKQKRNIISNEPDFNQGH